jgi:hypothetical protein
MQYALRLQQEASPKVQIRRCTNADGFPILGQLGLPDPTIQSPQNLSRGAKSHFQYPFFPKRTRYQVYILAIMDIEKDWKEELDEFGKRLKARKAAEKYAPWHPRNVVLHPTRTWRLAFGIIGDDEMEKALAHIDSGTAGSKDKPRPKPKQK